MARKPESLFKDRVRRDLETLPKIWFAKIQQVVIRGTPDFVVCLNGYFIALELKSSPKAKISAMQEFVIDRIHKAGGVAYVVHPDNWDEVFNYIKQYCEDDDAN